ncbi:MAG: hypothetical protein FWH56_11130 [Betaproteobacteria bacterium]|nr:hypothetical protein [Betaproteobacteria bacterium]
MQYFTAYSKRNPVLLFLEACLAGLAKMRGGAMKTVALFLFIFASYGYSQEAIKYDAVKNNITKKQQYFSKIYASSGTEKQKEVVREAQAYLTTTISDSLFSYWYGTPWNFNGTTKVPKQGTIACGYFVTAILSDAGFQIPRVKWAQSASEPVIVKIATNVQRFRNQPMNKLIDYLNKQGDGLYIVGLDNHVGFISKRGNNLRFIHSSYYHPETGVMPEPLEGHNPLNDSRYRIIGKLLDTEMTLNWINGVEYK